MVPLGLKLLQERGVIAVVSLSVSRSSLEEVWDDMNRILNW